MKLFLSCLLFSLGFTSAASVPDSVAVVKAFVGYIKLVGMVDGDPTYARLQTAEAKMHEAFQNGVAVFAQDHYVLTQKEFLKLFGAAFAKLGPAFAAAYPDAVISTFANGTRVVFRADHPVARALNIDPYDVDHPWIPFAYAGPLDHSFLDEAHAFIGRSAITLLEAALDEIKNDGRFKDLAAYGNTMSTFPADLEHRYRPVFAALRYAFSRRGPEALRQTVTWVPRSSSSAPRDFEVQDSLGNLLDFDRATGHFGQTIEMLESYVHSCTVELSVEIGPTLAH